MKSRKRKSHNDANISSDINVFEMNTYLDSPLEGKNHKQNVFIQRLRALVKTGGFVDVWWRKRGLLCVINCCVFKHVSDWEVSVCNENRTTVFYSRQLFFSSFLRLYDCESSQCHH